MVENIKLSIWDIFSSFFVGLLFFVFCFFYLYFFGYYEKYSDQVIFSFNNLSFGASVFLPFVIVVFGVIIDPIARVYAKVLSLVSEFFIIGSLWKVKKHRNLEALETSSSSKTEIDVPNIYRYCKSFVEIKGQSNLADIYLARMGFFRCLSLLLLLLAGLVWLEELDIYCSFFISIASFVLSVIYYRRGEGFKGHMEYEIYYKYLALKEIDDA